MRKVPFDLRTQRVDMKRIFNAFAAWLVACAASLSVSAAEAQAADPVQAVWMEQEVDFYFQSFTTYYSCSSLETKIRRILTALGARDLKLRTRGCISPHEIARLPSVRINLTAAVEATPEALAELEKTRSTRELIARARRDASQAQRDEEQFLAQWQSVSFARNKLHLDPGDCELIEQLKERVFPKLAIRVVDDQVRCSPNQPALAQPRLVVEALMPMPTVDDQD